MRSLSFLFLANALKTGAATFVCAALARRVTLPGVAVLVAVLATATDLLSVPAGRTKALTESIERGEPSLLSDLLGLLLLSPTFGNPIGFALGVCDLLFHSALRLHSSCSRRPPPPNAPRSRLRPYTHCRAYRPLLEPPAPSLAFHRPLVPSRKLGLTHDLLAPGSVNTPILAQAGVSNVKVY